MTGGSTITLPCRIGQRRNLAPVWIGESILVTVAAAFVAATAGMRIAVLAVAVVIGVCAILLGVLQLLRPATLTLDETGFTFIWLWRVHRWEWSNIDGFRVAHVRGGTVIMFEVYEGDGSSVAAMPAFFEMDAQNLVGMLHRVRRTTTDVR
jgi:hypothetical protein